jgi:hypothetical protein
MDDVLDVHCFNHQNVLKQLESSVLSNGYYELRFYTTSNGMPSAKPTDRISVFYLYPSGGTLRDENFQLLFYDSRYDTYRGFRPPHPERSQD